MQNAIRDDRQVRHFHDVGYLRAARVLGDEEARRLADLATKAASVTDDPRVLHTPEKVRVDQVLTFDQAFIDAASCAPMIAALIPLLGPNIELIENRHNHLSVFRVSGQDAMHRDILQWSRSILTVLLYLSDCTDLASATQVIPGSHRWPCAGAPNNGGTWLAQSTYEDLAEQAVPVPARAGDALLMHGQLYHAGLSVAIAEPRIVLALAYCSVDELASEPPPNCRLVHGQRIQRGRGAIRV